MAIRSRLVAGARPQVNLARPAAAVVARFGGGRGGGLLDKPSDIDVSKTAGWDSGKDTTLTAPRPEVESGSGVTKRNSGSGGAWRVLLLDSEKHTELTVVKAICMVVPHTDVNHAKNCYTTSKQLGLAIITTCLKEHAEFYRNQLYRYGCRAQIEPDLSAA